MTEVISLINEKGGVGKSTSAITIAHSESVKSDTSLLKYRLDAAWTPRVF